MRHSGTVSTKEALAASGRRGKGQGLEGGCLGSTLEGPTGPVAEECRMAQYSKAGWKQENKFLTLSTVSSKHLMMPPIDQAQLEDREQGRLGIIEVSLLGVRAEIVLGYPIPT